MEASAQIHRKWWTDEENLGWTAWKLTKKITWTSWDLFFVANERICSLENLSYQLRKEFQHQQSSQGDSPPTACLFQTYLTSFRNGPYLLKHLRVSVNKHGSCTPCSCTIHHELNPIYKVKWHQVVRGPSFHSRYTGPSSSAAWSIGKDQDYLSKGLADIFGTKCHLLQRQLTEWAVQTYMFRGFYGKIRWFLGGQKTLISHGVGGSW